MGLGLGDEVRRAWEAVRQAAMVDGRLDGLAWYETSRFYEKTASACTPVALWSAVITDTLFNNGMDLALRMAPITALLAQGLPLPRGGPGPGHAILEALNTQRMMVRDEFVVDKVDGPALEAVAGAVMSAGLPGDPPTRQHWLCLLCAHGRTFGWFSPATASVLDVMLDVMLAHDALEGALPPPPAARLTVPRL